MRDMNEIKKDLDRWDMEILDLLLKRFGCVAELAQREKEQGVPVFQPEDENFLYEDLLMVMGGCEYSDEVSGVFRQIIEESRRVQSRSLFDYNIVLIGFMGTGKSTVTRYLKQMLAMEEADVDAMIVEEQKMAIKDIFTAYGEEYFRNCESQTILSLQNCRRTVISCGGGAVLREENVKNLKKAGPIVLLTARPETILDRVKDSDERPVLNGNMNVEFVKQLMEKREAYYERAADVIIETDNKSVRQICQDLVAALIAIEKKETQ